MGAKADLQWLNDNAANGQGSGGGLPPSPPVNPTPADSGDTTLWAGAIIGLLTPLSQLMPLILGVGKLMLWVKGLNWAAMWQWIKGAIYVARVALVILIKKPFETNCPVTSSRFIRAI